MSENRLDEGRPRSEREIEELLRRFSHLMKMQEAAESRSDPTLVPDPAFARKAREAFAPSMGARSTGRLARRRRLWLTALAAAVLTGVIAVAVVLTHQVRGPYAHLPPAPRRSDLLFSFPSGPVHFGAHSPTSSSVHAHPGAPYSGDLKLQAGRLVQKQHTVMAYRLAHPRIARRSPARLDIRDKLHAVRSAGSAWLVASTGGGSSDRPLHSIAFSLSTGEVIYHDRRNGDLRAARHALAPEQAARVARRWLSRLGWPGDRMPVISTKPLEAQPKVLEVQLGWIGVRHVTTAGATLWVTPDRSVIESWVWPPIAKRSRVPARSIGGAFSVLQQRKVPVAVPSLLGKPGRDGKGHVRHASVREALVFAKRRVYLVPVWRFDGKVRIRGVPRARSWFSLVPAAGR